MSYLVMECHPGYAVVLDQQGRFLKAANCNYEVGQELEQIIPMELERSPDRSWKKQLTAFAAAAACLCLVMLGSWRLLAVPVGTVRMQINPDVMMWVNRLNYVTKVEGLNEDGQDLVDGVSVRGKKVEALSDELALRAVEMGYLKENGRVSLTVESEKAGWKTATEELLVLELEIHLPEQVQVTVGQESEQQPPVTDVQPEKTPQSGENSKGDKPEKEDKPAKEEKPEKEDKPEKTKKYITLDKAKKNALKHLGLDKDAVFTDREQDLDDGVYELEFTCDGVEYDVDVDAVTGGVLRVEQERLEPDEDEPDDPPDDDDEDDAPDDDEDDDNDDRDDDDDDLDDDEDNDDGPDDDEDEDDDDEEDE